jgi:hypothetical protein
VGRCVLLSGMTLAACLAGFAHALPPAETTTVAGARLGPVPEVLYAQMPALPRGQGVVVEDVESSSVLARAGLRRLDILLTLDRKAIPDGKRFAAMLAAARPETPHRLGLLRAGRPLTLALTLPGPEMTAIPKSVLKPGGPPAVSVEAQPLRDGKLRVNFAYYSSAGKLQQVSCSGSLKEIEQQVRQLGQQNQMPARVQDLMDVALRRLRTLQAPDGRP